MFFLDLASPSLVRVVEKLYADFTMELNIGDFKAIVAYTAVTTPAK